MSFPVRKHERGRRDYHSLLDGGFARAGILRLATDITIRTTGTSPVHMLLTYAGLLVTLLAHGGVCLYHRPA